MRIIPVLDLKDGEVVRASQGRRDQYRPIVTPLSKTSDPVDVATGLRSLAAFKTFYCADLDAIEHRQSNAEAISRLTSMHGGAEIWVDAGLSSRRAFDECIVNPSLRPVLGSESQMDETLLDELKHHPRLILSLDFFADGYRGPGPILQRPELWPGTVIVMTLAKVGAAAGPDLDRLAGIKAQAGTRTIVAAGGVRNDHDVRGLSAMGIQAALIATALHDGTLTAAHLAAFGA